MTSWVYKVYKPALLVNLKAANANVTDSESIDEIVSSPSEGLTIQSYFSNIIVSCETASSFLSTASNMKSGYPDSLLQFYLDIYSLKKLKMFDSVVQQLQVVMNKTTGVVTALIAQWQNIKESLWKSICPCRVWDDMNRNFVFRFQKKDNLLLMFLQSLSKYRGVLNIFLVVKELASLLVEN
ncbi:hypothetical protein PR048_008722 [Dryococelus australis]|uniref:Uncharacterized protein n=1 Tax=Dryococelus australis TaxID=614101 RepID=A0ABQ9HYS8_9NEOP|nr:hypothetical protein PR048_008722 [Dryococelus australis]